MCFRAASFPAGIYLVADFFGQCKTQFLWRIENALKGGVSVIQFRAKAIDDHDFLAMARCVQLICKEYKRPLIINDKVELARALDADGVHLGANDTCPVSRARKMLGRQAIIGASIARDQPITSDLNEADYLAASPVFLTRTKQDVGRPFGLIGLNALVVSERRPVIAIGGITEKNIRMVLKAGCRSIAMVSAIMEADSPKARALELKKIMDESNG